MIFVFGRPPWFGGAFFARTGAWIGGGGQFFIKILSKKAAFDPDRPAFLDFCQVASVLTKWRFRPLVRSSLSGVGGK